MGDFDEEEDSSSDVEGMVDNAMVRQLIHNQTQLAADKKRMERLFEEAEQDGSRKNEEIEAYKDTLARMRRELAATKAKVDADRAEKEREDELKEAERQQRRRRTLPKAPSKKRLSSIDGGKPSVIPVDTMNLDRADLVSEIRSLEAEMEYLHQEATRHAEENEQLRSLLEQTDGGPRHDDNGHGTSGIELPDQHIYATDAFEENPDLLVVSVVDGDLHAIIHGIGQAVEESKNLPLLFEQLEVLEAKNVEYEQQIELLRDAHDELNHELIAARQEAASASGTRTDTPDPDHGGEDLSVSLAESLAEIATTPEHALELANKDRKIESLTASLTSAQAENKRLEDTIAANREVMGMTVEEQMQMLEGRIGLMMQLDEAQETADELRNGLRKAQGDLEALQTYTSNRDHLVYTLLEKPIKSRDRKALLKLLQQTSQEATDISSAQSDECEVAPTPPPTPAREPQAQGQQAQRRASAPVAGAPVTPRNTASPRAAPAATPFPKELLRKLSESDLTAAADSANATPTPGTPQTPSGSTTPTNRPKLTEANVIAFVKACCKSRLDKKEPVHWKQLQNACLKKFGQANAARHMAVILSTAKETSGEMFITSID